MLYCAMTDLLTYLLTKFVKKKCIFERQLYNLKLKDRCQLFF